MRIRCRPYSSSIPHPRVQLPQLLLPVSEPTREEAVQTTATMILRPDNGYFAHPDLPTCRTGLPLSIAVPGINPMIAGISAPVLLFSRRAMRTSQPHDPSNSHRDPVTHPRIGTRLVGQRPRTRVSKHFLLPSRTTVRASSSDRAGPESAPVGRLLVHPTRVPQSSLVIPGLRGTCCKTIPSPPPPQIRLGRLTLFTPGPGQLVDQQIQISTGSTPHSATQSWGNSVPIHTPEPPNKHLTVSPEPY